MEGGGAREADRAEGLAFDRSSSHVQGTSCAIWGNRLSSVTQEGRGIAVLFSNTGGQRYSCTVQ